MITEDRIELNDRFRKIFSILEEKGKIVKNDRAGLGMGDFAEKVLGNRAYGHIVRAFLNAKDKRVIDYHQARNLCEAYGINEAWMLQGKGTPFGLDPVTSMPHDNSGRRPNILFTTTQAFAGSAIDTAEPEENIDYFTIPGLEGTNLVAFPIKGNSMEPVIQNGDVVVCREIESVNQIKDNEIYAVKSSGSVWVKYLQKMPDSRGRISSLRMISANHLEHDPFEEEINEYTRIYKVVRRICEMD